MSKKEAVVSSAGAQGTREHHRPVPRCVLVAYDALARHDVHAADPLDGAGIQLALEWEWERAEHGVPEGIAREDLVALTEGSSAATPGGEASGGAGKEKEEAA